MSDVLQGYVLLLPNEGRPTQDKEIKGIIRGKLNRALDSDISVDKFIIEDDDQTKKYAHYNELMIKADLNFGPIRHNQICKENILRRYCQENVLSGIGESWLYLDIFEIDEMIHTNSPILTSFSLGSIVYMNTFVEHFSSTWSATDKSCRITQNTVHFNHDIRKLLINFAVTDKSVRHKHQDLESCEIHELQLEYNMILRVLIEVEKQRAKSKSTGILGASVYLLLSGTPLLKVREVEGEDEELEPETGAIGGLDKISEAANTFSWVQKTSPSNDKGHNFVVNEENILDPKGYDSVNKVEGVMNLSKNDRHLQENICKKNKQRTENQKTSFGHSSNSRSNNTRSRSNNQYDNDNDAYKSSILKQRERAKSYVSATSADHKMKYKRASEFGKVGTMAHCSSKVLGMSRVLKLDIQSTADNENEVWETLTQIRACCPEAQVYFTSMKQHQLLKEFGNPSIANPQFDCLYALKTLTSPSFTVSDEINLKYNLKDVNAKLKSFAKEDGKALEKTLFDIQAKHEKGEILRFTSALDSLFEQNQIYLETIEAKKVLPDNIVMLRRAIMTPTRFIYLPPIAHMKSYLLRSTDPDFALRITIRDDNFDQLTFTVCGKNKNKASFLKKVIGQRLLKGFKIGDRQYEFFGSSTSQLREHGCLFYAKDTEGSTANSIRGSLGDLNKIHIVAKYMARMGQSLSQAMASVDLPKKFMVGPVSDVTRKDESGKVYIFSDGIGQMSQEVAEMCYEKLKLSESDYRPCAIQIRYAGCKGMLLLNPNLQGKKIILRESMWKYNSDNQSLEILKASFPQKAYLNRPFVAILEQMGIEKQVFFKLQSEQLHRIIKSLYDSKDAALLLKEESVLRLPFQRLHSCGVDLALEPFFRPMIMAVYKNAIGVLKTKSRIKLPFEEARTMFGVMDETGTLEYGQVYVQYTKDIQDGVPTKQTAVLTGIILVTKNPCMHPGDVRKFMAIDVPALAHVKDCIVFPQKGPRPHSDEMAGSDLDGDEYCIVWSEDLIFQRDNYEAMDYSNNLEAKKNFNIGVKDMVEFVCDYIRDDCVGLIASAHLAWADSLSIFDEKCMTIAKKYSVTLDFAKSGKPEELSRDERVSVYPDFMEKFREKDSYLSTKALGYLFRNCKHVELVSNILSSEVPVEINPSLEYEGWQEYEKSANKSLFRFISLFSTPTRLFHLTNEGEIMSGAVKKLEKTFQGKNIEKNIGKMLESVIPHVIRKMKTEFFRAFLNCSDAQALVQGCSNDKEKVAILQDHVYKIFKLASTGFPIDMNPLLNEMLKMASAWYVVAYQSKKDGSSLYLGLPWVVSELMGILHSKHIARKPSLQLKIKMFLNRDAEAMERVLGQKPIKDQAEFSKQVMRRWLNESEEKIFLRNNKKLLQKELDNIIHEVQKSDDVLEANADALIFRYFTRMADAYSSVQFLDGITKIQDANKYWITKEMGLLAIVALSSISCTGKIWEDEEENLKENAQSKTEKPLKLLGLAFLTKEFREELRFPLNLGARKRNKLGNIEKSDFEIMMLRRTNDVCDLLKRHSKVSMLKIDFKEPKGGNRWYVLLSAYGKAFNIECLKDMIVQPSFPKKVVDAINDDCCII